MTPLDKRLLGHLYNVEVGSFQPQPQHFIQKTKVIIKKTCDYNDFIIYLLL